MSARNGADLLGGDVTRPAVLFKGQDAGQLGQGQWRVTPLAPGLRIAQERSCFHTRTALANEKGETVTVEVHAPCRQPFDEQLALELFKRRVVER